MTKTNLLMCTLFVLLGLTLLSCEDSELDSFFDGDKDIPVGDNDRDLQSDGDKDQPGDKDKDPQIDGDKETDTVDPDEDSAEEDKDPDKVPDEDKDPGCTCFAQNDCCDGCHPVNEGGDCNDGLLCTVGTCKTGVCEGELILGNCLIDGVCFEMGAENPQNVCQICRPIFDAENWSNADNGSQCDDGDPNTSNDICTEGQCLGTQSGCECAGENTCCDGCNYINEDQPCESDGLFCTDDLCRSGLCMHELKDNFCKIGDVCYTGGLPSPDNDCKFCDWENSPDAWINQADNTPCEDGNFCTLDDTCMSGVCTEGDAKECPASEEECKVLEGCYDASGECVYGNEADDTACDDGNSETSNDSCQNGVCLGEGCVCGTVDECCDGCNAVNEGTNCTADNISCTSDMCGGGFCMHEVESGWCMISGDCYPDLAEHPQNVCLICDADTNPEYWTDNDGTACEDGNYCTVEDSCDMGQCLPGQYLVCQEPLQCMFQGECDPYSGICDYYPLPDGTDCDDGNAETENDECANGLCLGKGCECNGTNACCDGCHMINEGGLCADDDIDCTLDTCSAGICEHNFAPGWCYIDGECFINGSDHPDSDCMECDVEADQFSWVAKEDMTACDDENACTQEDTCQNGQCLGENEIDCSQPPSVCMLPGECDLTDGQCIYGLMPDDTPCDDGNPATTGDSCQDGLCLGAGCQCNQINDCCDGCNIINNGASCVDDGLSCTGDTCSAGVCQHELENGYCLIEGECYESGDLNPEESCWSCNTDQDSYSWTMQPGGSLCDDDNACTLKDECSDGVCIGSNPVLCSPVDSCHLSGICEPDSGVCLDGPPVDDETYCNDGLFCNGDDWCIAGDCQGHEWQNYIPPACLDSNPCTLDLCYEDEIQFACENSPKTGTDCDDGLYCNGEDICNMGTCVHEWLALLPPDCIDGNECTGDACEEGQITYQCVNNQYTGTSCSDGDPCSAGDFCDDGQCQSGTPKICTPPNECQTGACNQANGQCTYTPLQNGSQCDDYDNCTEDDQCIDGSCEGSDLVCDSPGLCYELPGDCEESSGECEYAFASSSVACDDGNQNTGDDHCDGQGHCIGGACECDNSDAECCSDCMAMNESGACDDGDGLTCTGGSCTGGYCTSQLANGYCIINGECLIAGTAHPQNPCMGCLPNLDVYGWSNYTSSTSCNDGLACNGNDTCDGQGACSHEWPSNIPPACNDNEVCIMDSCDESGGGQYACNHQNLTGTACDDGLYCNGGDICSDGVCSLHEWQSNLPPACEDDNECTSDSCNEGASNYECDNDSTSLEGAMCQDEGLYCTEDICESGQCAHKRMAGWCIISAACHANNATNPSNECEQCAAYSAPEEWSPKQDGVICSGDGETCTVDVCLSGQCNHDTVSQGSCYISGDCCSNNFENPANECEYCDATMDQTSWSAKADSTPCTDDLEECTEDYCLSGACEHPAKPASASCMQDNYTCTEDHCDGSGLCMHELQADTCVIGGICYADESANPQAECKWCDASTSCFGYDAYNQTTLCTWVDKPSGYACSEDNYACSIDECDGEGVCDHSQIESANCLIDAQCFNDDDTDPQNECLYCDAALSQTDWTPYGTAVTCDDDEFCTIEDHCNGMGACDGEANLCHESPDISCTADICDEAGDQCLHPITQGYCLIDGTCYSADGSNPGNDCQYCASGQSQTAWTPRPQGYSCDDEEFCTIDDECNGQSVCEGDPNPCHESPDMTCTDDTCNEQTTSCEHSLNLSYCLIGGQCIMDGISNPQNDCQFCDAQTDQYAWSDKQNGTQCNDKLYCTVNDICDGMGACGGSPRDCHENPDLKCTTDSCDEIGNQCLHSIDANWCAIGGTCYIEDTTNPQNVCEICNTASSQTAWSANDAASCDDGIYCNGADNCDSSGTCIHEWAMGLPPDCDDDNFCTADDCNEEAAGYTCSHDAAVMNGRDCDDGNLCTEPDECEYGWCVGLDKHCDDTNQCTHDRCDTSTGLCQYDNLPDGTVCEYPNSGLCTWDYCATDPTGPVSTCHLGTAPNCNDENECTRDSCDPQTGLCLNEPVEDHTPCDCDENLCTQDACIGGRCIFNVHGEVVCDHPENWPFGMNPPTNLFDDNCFDDFCEPETGQCEYIPFATQSDGPVPVVCGIDMYDEPMYCQDGPADLFDGCCEVCDKDSMGNCLQMAPGAYISTCCIPRWSMEFVGIPSCCTPIQLGAEYWIFISTPSETCEDDGLGCTMDYCDNLGFCIHDIAEGYCVIDNICYRAGALNPANPCEICAPIQGDYETQVNWNPLEVGTPCEDPCSECTISSCGYLDEILISCLSEFAPGIACDDGNDCTEDYCAPDGKTCVNREYPDYTPCDDGENYNINDVCVSGQCSHADLLSPPSPDKSSKAIIFGPPEGHPDIVFSTGAIGVYSPAIQDYEFISVTEETYKDVTIADIDRDGFYDMVFSGSFYTGDSLVIWGPPDVMNTPTPLRTLQGTYNCVGDVDNDGWDDIVIADYEMDSVIYWGNPSAPRSITDYTLLPIPEYGAVGCAIIDTNGDGFMDIVFTQDILEEERAEEETVSIWVYMGERDPSSGEYLLNLSEGNWTYPARDIGAAQFNPQMNGLRDFGLVDFAISQANAPYSIVLWDAASGQQHSSGISRAMLPMYFMGLDEQYHSAAHGNTVMDIDMDGAYDIVFSSPLGEPYSSRIFYGNPSGNFDFDPGSRLPAEWAYGNAVGDLDNSYFPNILLSSDLPIVGSMFYPPTYDMPSLMGWTGTKFVETEMAGTYTHLRQNCPCHKLNLCCDGCYPYNDGHYCNENETDICIGGRCLPITEASP